jgi:hypothetical protein
MEPQDVPGEVFDQLCLLRRCYPLRSAYDRRSDLTVDDVVALAERLLTMAAVQHPWRNHNVRHRAG